LTTEFDKFNAHLEEMGWQKRTKLKSYAYHNYLVCQNNIIAQFKAQLEQRLAEQESPARLNMFVRSVQVQLTLLGNNLCNPTSAELSIEGPSHIQTLKRLAGEAIMEILEYLHVYFAPGFDTSMSVPNCFIPMKGKHQSLMLKLREKSIDDRLLKILDNYLNSITDPINIAVKSWRQLDYLDDLSGVLLFFANSAPTEDDNLKLILLLTAYNFNNVIFYEYVLEYINGIAGNNELNGTEEAKLKNLLFKMEDVRTERTTGYDTTVPIMRETLCKALKRKLSIVKSTGDEQYSQMINNTKGKSGLHFFEVKEPLKQVLFILWVLTDMQLFVVKYHEKLFDFMHRFVKQGAARSHHLRICVIGLVR